MRCGIFIRNAFCCIIFGMNLPYYSVSDFYKKIFGQKIYKLSIDGGCTCPNRDGAKGTGGCIFCSQGGSGEFSVGQNDSIYKLSIAEQLERAKKLVVAKMPKSQKNCEHKFIAYFQNFTNTYGDFAKLSSQFLQAAQAQNIVGIAIATRPDCLGDKMLDFLAALSERTFVQLEFGLQTSNDRTAAFINRRYSTSEYDNAMRRVKNAAPKIHIATHIIFGLSNETENEMLETVRHAVQQKTDGIKITTLHVLRGTKLAALYEKGLFKVLTQEEYFALLKSALEIIPKEIVIHRLTGDGAKRILVAPMWTANKRKVWNDLMRALS